MFIFSMLTSLFVYFSGVYVCSSKRKHLLMVLLSLEYIVLFLFMLLMIFLFCFDFDYFFPVVILVFSVCEGALGLSILVSVIRSHGNDFFNSFFFIISLSYLFMIVFLIPICLLKNCWWLVHSLMFLLSFVFMIFVYSYSDINMISYIFGIDYFSFSLILLSFWVCSLMITASSSIYSSSYYSSFFVLFYYYWLYCSFSSLSLLSFYMFFFLV